MYFFCAVQVLHTVEYVYAEMAGAFIILSRVVSDISCLYTVVYISDLFYKLIWIEAMCISNSTCITNVPLLVNSSLESGQFLEGSSQCKKR